MIFEPQNPLEQALVKATHNIEHRLQFYQDFLSSEIFFISAEPVKAGSINPTEENHFKIQRLQLDGKLYIPIFSSVNRLHEVIRETVNYVALNALELLKIIQGEELILNPGSEYAKEFTRTEILSLLSRSFDNVQNQSYHIPKSNKILIGQPARYPHELVDTLSALFKKHKGVKKAYVAHFFVPGKDEKPHTLVALDITEGWEKIMTEVGAILRYMHIPDPPVDFVRLEHKQDMIENYFLKEAKPFYVQNQFGK